MLRFIALLLFTSSAIAGTNVITWTQPTQDTSGNTLGGSSALTANTLYRGTKADGSDLVLFKQLPLPRTVTNYTDGGLAAGTYCYAVTASNALGESDKSAVQCKTIAAPQGPPLPPTLVSVATTAYTIGVKDGRYAMIPVGTVPLGTECRQAVKIATLYQVPTANVTTTSKAAWFFAKCA